MSVVIRAMACEIIGDFSGILPDEQAIVVITANEPVDGFLRGDLTAGSTDVKRYPSNVPACRVKVKMPEVTAVVVERDSCGMWHGLKQCLWGAGIRHRIIKHSRPDVFSVADGVFNNVLRAYFEAPRYHFCDRNGIAIKVYHFDCAE